MILAPYKYAGYYVDGRFAIVKGYSKDECIQDLCDLQERHGEMKHYTGVTDDYYIDGECITHCRKKCYRCNLECKKERLNLYIRKI